MSDLLAMGDMHLVVQRAQAADLVMPSKLANIMAAGRPAVATAAADTELHDLLSRLDCGVVVALVYAAALAGAVAAGGRSGAPGADGAQCARLC